MSSANNLFKDGSKSADWAIIYPKAINTFDLLSDNLTTTGFYLKSGNASVNWAPGGTIIVGGTLKSYLQIQVSLDTIANNEFFIVEFHNTSITPLHQANVTFNLNTDSPLNATLAKEVLAGLNIFSYCIDSEAIIKFTNISGGNLPSVGSYPANSFLSFNVVIC